MPIACLSTAGLELLFMTGCTCIFCPVCGELKLLLWLGVNVLLLLSDAVRELWSRMVADSWLRSDCASWFSLVEEPSSSSSLDDELEFEKLND